LSFVNLHAISSEKNNWFTPVLIISLLIIVFCALYVSTYFTKQNPVNERKEFDYAGRPVQAPVKTDQAVLKKNERFVIGRNRLVFKGVDRKMILIDLYLLDMDSEQPYRKRFLKKEAKKEFLLGQGT
jgi:hypothetical protein